MTVELRIVAPDQRTLDAAVALLVRQLGSAVAFEQARAGRDGHVIAYGRLRADYAAPPRFVCPRCGRVSYHPRELAERYCGNCDQFFPDYE